MKRSLILSVLSIASAMAATAQPEGPSPWTLSLSPSVALPLTSGGFGANELLAAAWGASLGVEYAPRPSVPLSFRLGLGYAAGGLLPVGSVAVPGSLSEATALVGAAAGVRLTTNLDLLGFVDAGLSLGRSSDGRASAYGAARAGGGLGLAVTDSLSARLDASWLYKFGLYGGLGISLGMGYRLPEPPPGASGLRSLEISSLELTNVFPIFKSFYDDNAVGTVTIVNKGRKAVADVRVSYVMRQYMTGSKECAVVPRIEPGKSVTLPLFALFDDRILGVTEATKSTAEVTVEYRGAVAASRTATVLVYDRNALTWDDDRHAAAFVSSKDPWVLDLSGNMAAATMDSRNAEVAENLQAGIAFHEGLRVYGIGYVLSPNRPFAAKGADLAAVDSLKFPRQTLGYRAGDCADLSVLYASFFEAAGIESAFITVPGHIFMAFDLGLSPDELRSRSLDERDLVFAGGKAWLPIETTLRSSGFVEAWRAAAAQWRAAEAEGRAGFFPVRDAWKTYPPVGLPADASVAASPAAAAVGAAFRAELAKVVAMELKARLGRLGPEPAAGAARFRNERGVLYAKYGEYADAERDLKAAARDQYGPAIVNLGNVAFIRAEYSAAYGYYAKAAALGPDDPRLLVSMARAAAALGRTDDVSAALARAGAVDPGIAERYASLIQDSSTSGRAAQAGTGGTLWF